jgi:hypothetical protein
MYQLILCASVIAGYCPEYKVLNYPNYEQCKEQQDSLNRQLKSLNGFAICRSL